MVPGSAESSAIMSRDSTDQSWWGREKGSVSQPPSDPYHRSCSSEGHCGACLIVKINHGVVGCSHAAEGSACPHLSVPETLQVALREERGGHH